MSKGREAQSVECPYFVRFSYSGIVCEGFSDKTVTEIRFNNYSERSRHIKRFCNCYDQKHERCPLANFFDEYYSKLDDYDHNCRFSPYSGVRCEVRIDSRMLFYGFVYGKVNTLYLPAIKQYSELRSAKSNGDSAYQILFRWQEECEIIMCSVRLGYVPKNKGGMAGVKYWIVEKIEKLDR